MKEQWYLRREDGSIFGPTDHDEFVTWAMNGRIGPDDDVSQDQHSWSPAPQLQDLEMVWSIHFGDEHLYGPFNVYALVDLAEENHLSYSAELIHVKTGKRHQLGNVLLPLLYAERESMVHRVQQDLAKDIEESKTLAESVRHELRAREEDLEDVRAQLLSKSKQHTMMAEKAMVDHQGLLQEREAAAKTIQTQEQEMLQVVDIFKKKEDELAGLHHKIKELNNRLDDVTKESKGFQTQIADLKSQLEGKAVAAKEFEENQASAEKQWAAEAVMMESLKTEIDRLRESNDVSQKSFIDEKRELQARLEALRVEIDTANSHLSEARAQEEILLHLREELDDSHEELQHARVALEKRDSELMRLKSSAGPRSSSLIQQAMNQKTSGPNSSQTSGSTKTSPPSQSASSGVRREPLKDTPPKNQLKSNLNWQSTPASQGVSGREIGESTTSTPRRK